MTCERFTMPGGGVAIVCSRGRRKAKPPKCSECGGVAGFQCDHVVARGKTCDVFLCDTHAIVAPVQAPLAGIGAPLEERHLCPRHAFNPDE